MTTEIIMLTPEQAQVYLAKLMPEKIQFSYDNMAFWKRFDDKNFLCWSPVTTHEWLAIAQMVEEKMNKAQQINYVAELWTCCGFPLEQAQDAWWALLHATYIQRATAMQRLVLRSRDGERRMI
jgi:hypothetical protein